MEKNVSGEDGSNDSVWISESSLKTERKHRNQSQRAPNWLGLQQFEKHNKQKSIGL